MSKNTSTHAFRRIDVDQYDEEKFHDEQTEQGDTGPDANTVNNLLMGGNALDALKACLQNPPIRTKSVQVKEQATLLFVRVISTMKVSEISNTLQSLSTEEVDTLMKYIYKGFSLGLDGQQCGFLLTWHEKVAAKGGMGCIIRVLSDRKRL